MPVLDGAGVVHVSLKDKAGVRSLVRAKYLVVADGAGSPTLKQLGVGTKLYAQGKVAAAFFGQKGGNVMDYDHGVARVADIDSTYTLTALPRSAEQLTGKPLEDFVRTHAGKVGIDPAATMTKSWTFDATMQHAKQLLLMEDHLLVVGDAASTPHPLTGMGVNKAIYEAELTADSIGRMLGTEDPRDRCLVALAWKAKMHMSKESMHRQTLLLFEKFGTVRAKPSYLDDRRAKHLGTPSVSGTFKKLSAYGARAGK